MYRKLSLFAVRTARQLPHRNRLHRFAACLAHDFWGNPPFGHSGERAISTFFLKEKECPEGPTDTFPMGVTFTHFEGNANAFRLLLPV